MISLCRPCLCNGRDFILDLETTSQSCLAPPSVVPQRSEASSGVLSASHLSRSKPFPIETSEISWLCWLIHLPKASERPLTSIPRLDVVP